MNNAGNEGMWWPYNMVRPVLRDHIYSIQMEGLWLRSKRHTFKLNKQKVNLGQRSVGYYTFYFLRKCRVVVYYIFQVETEAMATVDHEYPQRHHDQTWACRAGRLVSGLQWLCLYTICRGRPFCAYWVPRHFSHGCSQRRNGTTCKYAQHDESCARQ